MSPMENESQDDADSFSATGSPLCVNVEGGRVYISAHDAFHLAREREFKRLIPAPRTRPQSLHLGRRPHP